MAGAVVIGADELRDRLAGLGDAGPVTRLAWTEELAAAEAWFGDQAAAAGLRVARDPAGSLWALPDGDGPWWATGSHLDSVRRGGRFDGPLGVAAGFAVAERLPGVAVIAFADEEGARFNTPTFGSRALTGRLDVADVLARRDDDGVALADAMAAAGADPAGSPGRRAGWRGCAGSSSCTSTRPRTSSGSAPRPARSARSPRGRGSRSPSPAAPTTRARRAAAERRDALAAAAQVIVAADELAGGDPDFLVTATRIEVEPNAFTTVPSAVRLWIDARTPDPARLDAWRDALAARTGTVAADVTLATASRSDGVSFEVVDAFGELPELVCFAGHDAGILAARIPAGMVFVRNPTGVSHAPEEDVSMDDAAVAATALLGALERVA